MYKHHQVASVSNSYLMQEVSIERAT